VQYTLAVTVDRCLRYRATRYLADCCAPVSEVSGRQHLRSASRRKLNIPRFRRRTFGTCGFSQSPVRLFGTHCLIRCVIRPSSLNVVGGTWKRISLPDIRDASALVVSPFHGIALYRSTFTYLLAYFILTKKANVFDRFHYHLIRFLIINCYRITFRNHPVDTHGAVYACVWVCAMRRRRNTTRRNLSRASITIATSPPPPVRSLIASTGTRTKTLFARAETGLAEMINLVRSNRSPSLSNLHRSYVKAEGGSWGFPVW